ncbi:Variant surface glycoprotein [Trypanosoma congolense IL3000]|uniref:Variant surface glycoprotein n=1 Tax=Trypanosoma congolense (strain IL3000) TaxID=1068625 RepID=F9W682_TRYCI|nr:Variant surface glycoprotein [Trypanosoma congolense IL3000]
MMIVKKMLMMMMGVMVMSVQANVEEKTGISGFELLCEAMKVTTGAWMIGYPTEYSDEFDAKMKEFGRTINKIFFGEKGSESHFGYWVLPENFEGNNPKRNAVCGLEGGTTIMPLASKSMASAFLCLCMSTDDSPDDICGLGVEGSIKWPESGRDIKEAFKKVWGREPQEGIRKVCEGSHASFSSLEEAEKNLTASLNSLESALTSKGGVLCTEKTECDKTLHSVHVTPTPAWLELLRKVEKDIPILVEELKRRPSPDPEPASSSEILPSPTESPESTSITEPVPITSRVSQEYTEQEPRKTSEKKPMSELVQVPKSEPEPEKTIEAPQKQEEDTLSVSESETSSSVTKKPIWLFWAALLI